MRTPTLGVFALVVLSVVTIRAVQAQSGTRTLDDSKPEVIAIKFHADWCGSCGRMGDVFENLATIAEDEPVLFVRLDLTDRSSRKQAQYLMSLLNLQQIWEQAGAGQKTGFILLVDVDSRQPLGKLTADQDLKQMKAALLDVVAKSRS